MTREIWFNYPYTQGDPLEGVLSGYFQRKKALRIGEKVKVVGRREE